MTRFSCSVPLLAIMLACLTGCGTNHTLGEGPGQPVQRDTAQVAASAPPPVCAEEQSVLTALRELGAVTDLDDTGHVRILELNDSQATDDDLKLLSQLPHLESLDITGGKITAEGLVHLKGLQGLQRLYLNDLPITDEALASLADLTKLKVLSLRNTKIDDDGIPHLKALTRLHVLNLAKTSITNKSLKQIQGLLELDTLVLVDTKVTGEGFEYLKPLKKLRVLNMDRCQDLTGHFMDLSGLTELRMLYTHGCTVSSEEIAELISHNRRLAVFGD